MSSYKKVIKGIKCILLSLVLILTSTLCSFVPAIKVNADDADAPTYVDKNYSELVSSWTITSDELIYNTYAGQRNSAVSFGYVGITLSRCAPNTAALANGAATEWIALTTLSGGMFNRDRRNIVTKDGHTVVNENVHAYLSDIYNEIARNGYTEWANEFKAYYIDHTTSDVCYLRLDFILITRYNYSDGSRIESGDYDAENKSLLFGEVYMNTPDIDGTNPYQIRTNAVNPRTGGRPVNWSRTTKNDFDKFYNIYLPAGGNPGNPPAVGGPTSLFETKHESVAGFDISQAIPAGEQVKNTVSASCLTGSVNVMTQTVSSTYSYVWGYSYETKHMVLRYVGSTRNYHGSYDSSGNYVGDGDYSRRQTGSHYDYTYVGQGRGNYPVPGGPFLRELVPEYTYDYVGHTDTPNGDRNSSGVYVGANRGEYEYQWDGTYDTNYLASQQFDFDISASFQYIIGIDISLIDSISVYNSAFPGGVINYSASELSNRNVTVSLVMRSLQASNAGRTYDTISSGTNLGGYNFSPNSSHYYFPASPGTSYTQGTVNLGRFNNENEAKEARKNDIISKYTSKAQEIGNDTWTKNDQIVVNDNGTSVTFMDAAQCNGATVRYAIPGQTQTEVNVGTQSATDSSHNYSTDEFTVWVNGFNANRSTAAKVVTIPTTTPNGDCPTGISATWNSMFGSGPTTFVAGRNYYPYGALIYNHVISGGVLSHHNGGDPDDGYPIRIHTPVVAPLSIVYYDETNAYENTQLVAAQLNSTANYELLLDKMYYLRFDNDQWYSQVYGIPPGYANAMDQYVQKKQVRFPFTVVYEGKIYEKTGTGYTQWIDVVEPYDITTSWDYGVDKTKYESANHWQMMPFYIPSFADDCGATGSNTFVEVAVTAINYTGTPLDSNDDTAVNIINENTLTSQYVATSRKQVQLSGWIYDFTVVGTDNQAMYTGNNLTSPNVYERMGDISFANLKAELKSGATNRLGTGNLRYLKDGSLITSLNILQTLPLRTGQSFVFNNMGNVWKGQTFGFSIKTISDLNGQNDYIRITPHFHYINAAGEVLDNSTGEFKMYLASEADGKMQITEYNPGNTSLNGAETAYLGMEMFSQSFYDAADSNGSQQLGNWVASSVSNENINNAAAGYLNTVTAREFMNRKTSSYTVNTIYIPSTLRFMSGEYEQLEMNDGKAYDRATGTTTLTTYWNTITNYSTLYEEQFKYSMQQWMSCYMIPTNTFVIDTRTLGGSAFNIYNYIDAQSSFSFDTSTIVEHDEGTLVIGFDIVAYKNGVPYLTYSGANNMWLTESPTTPTPDPSDKVYVDMTKSMEMYWEVGIQNIN